MAVRILRGGEAQMDRAMPESIRWALVLAFLEEDPAAVGGVLDLFRRTNGVATHRMRNDLDSVSIRPLPFSGLSELAFTDHGSNYWVEASGLRGRWKGATVMVHKPKDGRAVPPNDLDALCDGMREALAAARLFVRRIEAMDDPQGGRLLYHWLREISLCAATQAGSIPEGRMHPCVFASSPLRGDTWLGTRDAWRPTASMQKAIDDVLGGSVFVSAHTRDGDHLMLTVSPVGDVPRPSTNMAEAMRRMARMMREGDDWAERIP